MAKKVSIYIISLTLSILIVISSVGCGVYSFKDVSIDYAKIKTIKIGFFENKARYINPQLSPKLTDKLQQKIVSQTKLIRTNNDDANLQVSGYVSDYSVTTVSISSTQSTGNRLTVGVHLIVKNTVDNKTDEFDISRSFDFSANLSLQQAETSLLTDIVQQVTDEIFNHIFSNW
ncbi:LPS assembly lipoprotein LptE [Parasediminibacterium sp. JCM 36343]|uniref:LPS assembly lipoprotein LptE n=1 Tax=Parasediminibacterium sp. JCM 36343 TaxID=3374279 RepID=UPI00397E768C